MAITSDGWFVDTYVKAWNNDIALDLGDSTPSAFKLAMFLNTLTVDFSQSNPAYGSAPFDASEVSGTGYSAGGLALTSLAFNELTAGVVRWDFANLSWASSTITAAKGCLIYATALSNRAVLFRNFGAEYGTNDGTFAINLHADGIAKSLVVV
jgi:hypothetical protein